MIFKLYRLLPKPDKRGVNVYIDVDQEQREANAFEPKTHALLRKLKSPSLVNMSAVGIRLSGFEQYGHSRGGDLKSRYQEWFLAYPKTNNE